MFGYLEKRPNDIDDGIDSGGVLKMGGLLVASGFPFLDVHNLGHEVAIGTDCEADHSTQQGPLKERLIQPLLQHETPHLDVLDVFVLCLLCLLIILPFRQSCEQLARCKAVGSCTSLYDPSS